MAAIQDSDTPVTLQATFTGVHKTLKIVEADVLKTSSPET